MKKLILLLAALAVVTLLAGCHRGGYKAIPCPSFKNSVR